ncbi:restriction endonuclease type I, S subunit [Sphaerisporangium melleum]|uniref:Restriction endonuclease type I, S subunit n=1 Tax=Sphaerisporangium melleum TaxID=321316 RepID=A0A917VFK9_9ACTN|nr:restriction endonuclease subunit S [Sphaerisporangium melleum]GGK71032.1 restriction endonuclease type I, S subunit [Sphaerisporangium melleum]GII70231.1 restriction endonuclease type I, S subunit [Sphaerisporangium melleum]
MTDLPSGWERVPLGDLGTWYGGGTPSKARADFWDNGSVPWLSPKDMGTDVILKTQDHITEVAVESSAVRLVPAGSVAIVVRSGILERKLPIGLVPFATTLNQDMKAVVPLGGIDPRWIAWGLRSLEGNILRDCRKAGTTVASIEASRLMELLFPVPPLAEQHRIIAAIEGCLSHLDKGEKSLDAVSGKMEMYFASLLQSAVTGGLSSRDGTDGSVVDLISRSKTLLGGERSRDDSNRRDLPSAAKEVLAPVDLPESWRWVQWRELGRTLNGVAFPSADYASKGIRLIRPGNLHSSGRLEWSSSNTRYLPVEYMKKREAYLIRGQALVMNLTAQSLKDQFLGRVCLTGAGEEALLNQRLARLTPVAANIEYVWLVFRSPIFRRFVDRLNGGSLIQHIHSWQIDRFLVPLPPLSEQERIVATVKEGLSLMVRMAGVVLRSKVRIMHLRRALLADAISGHLIAQNPQDEPASMLLEQIKTERGAVRVANRQGSRTRQKSIEGKRSSRAKCDETSEQGTLI